MYKWKRENYLQGVEADATEFLFIESHGWVG